MVLMESLSMKYMHINADAIAWIWICCGILSPFSTGQHNKTGRHFETNMKCNNSVAQSPPLGGVALMD